MMRVAVLLCIGFHSHAVPMSPDAICQTMQSGAIALTDDICNKISQGPPSSATSVKEYQEMCRDLVGSKGHKAAGLGQWSATFHAIGDDSRHAQYFWQFCLLSLSGDNEGKCTADGSDPQITTGSADNVIQYEMFAFQQIATSVKHWGVPEKILPNPYLDDVPHQCTSYQCMAFDKTLDAHNKHQMLMEFQPLVYEWDSQDPSVTCDEQTPILKLLSQVSDGTGILDAPICEDQENPQRSCGAASGKYAVTCPCGDVFGGCATGKHMSTSQANEYFVQEDPTGHPTGWFLWTQKGVLKSACGSGNVEVQLQGYSHPTWRDGVYYGGLPAWGSAIFALVLGCGFFGAWVVFFWSARKKSDMAAGKDDQESAVYRMDIPVDGDGVKMPFLKHLTQEVQYHCAQCSQKIETVDLADTRHCPTCGMLIENLLVVDPDGGSRIKPNQWVSSARSSQDGIDLDDGRAPQ